MSCHEEIKKVIDIKSVLRQKAPALSKKLPSFVVNYLTRLVHQDELNYILTHYKDKDGVEFMEALIDYFQLTLDTHGLENIPQPEEGRRLIFASNHPLGGLDGICLSALLGKHYNGDIRYPVNDLLLFIPNLRSIFVPINKHGSQSKDAVNLSNQAYASDNQIITFPAGLCSRKQKGKIVDLPWKKSFITKAIEYQRDIAPIYFEGRNSNFFYNLANTRKHLGIRANLEMVFLSDELFKCKQKTFNIYFGKPIPWQTFTSEKKPDQWATYVKEVVYKLKENGK